MSAPFFEAAFVPVVHPKEITDNIFLLAMKRGSLIKDQANGKAYMAFPMKKKD
jgi:hypothetical protein